MTPYALKRRRGVSSVGATPAPLAWSTLAKHRLFAGTLEGPTSGPPCGGLLSYAPHARHHHIRTASSPAQLRRQRGLRRRREGARPRCGRLCG